MAYTSSDFNGNVLFKNLEIVYNRSAIQNSPCSYQDIGVEMIIK